MKKILNEDIISNELREGSAFFRKPSDDKSNQTKRKPNTTQSDEAYASRGASEARGAYAAHASHEARKLIRRPIQIYEDQLNRMRVVSARSVLEGKPQLLREVFQEAIEEYLQKREASYPKR